MCAIISRIPQIRIPGKVQYLLLYTFAFVVIFIIGHTEFLFGDYTFILYGDALVQTFPSFIYVGEYFRALPGHLLGGELPMYDFSIGLGDDILSTLIAPIMPLNVLLFAFTSRDQAYAMYVVTIITQLYFSGLTFTYFCYTAFRNSNINRSFILLATLVYTFSGWTYVYILLHPGFMPMLLYFPVVMAGFDKILRGQKPYLFIVSIFFTGITGFYSLYMMTIFIIIYAFIRIHYLHKDNYWKNVWGYGVKSAGYYLIGLAMASFVIIPLVIAHFSTGRGANVTTDSLLYYPLSNYINSFLSYHSAVTLEVEEYNVRLGLSAVIPVALIILFSQKPYKKHLIIGVIITFLIQNIPLGTFILNGFAYPTNRTEFMFNFVYSIALIFVLRDLHTKRETSSESAKTDCAEWLISKRIDKKAIIAILIYILTLSIVIQLHPDLGNLALLFLFVGVCFIALIFLILLIPVDNPNLSIFNQKRRFTLLTVIVVLNIAITISTYNLYVNIRYVSKTANDMFEDYVDVTDFVEDDSFYRQGTPFTLTWHHFNRSHYVNEAVLGGYNGFTEYWSFMNPAYADFSFELENSEQAVNKWRIDGFNNRAPLYLLTSVKYLFDTYDRVPQGYEHITDLPYRSLYRNIYALPLGYTYERAISNDAYALLHPLDKQDAIMQAVALPPQYANTDISQLNFEKVSIEYTTSLEDGEIIVKPDSVLICQENCEYYVRFVGLSSESRDNIYGVVSLSVNDSENTQSFRFATQHNIWYSGRENHIIKIISNEETVSKIRLYLTDNINLDDIELYRVHVDSFAERAQALGEDVLKNIVVSTNKVTGSILLDREKILVLSIPYSEGWSARVNGESRELLKANTAFMALILTPGDYDIELTYETPGLRVGAIISLLGLIAFVGVSIFSKKE